MQRAAIARALVAQPNLLLADEPTGNLDQATGAEIIRILRALNRERNLTIVMVTHDRSIADQADRIVRLADGRIERIGVGGRALQLVLGLRTWALGLCPNCRPHTRS